MKWWEKNDHSYVTKENVQLYLSNISQLKNVISLEIAKFLQNKSMVSSSLAGAQSKEELKFQLKNLLF